MGPLLTPGNITIYDVKKYGTAPRLRLGDAVRALCLVRWFLGVKRIRRIKNRPLSLFKTRYLGAHEAWTHVEALK